MESGVLTKRAATAVGTNRSVLRYIAAVLALLIAAMYLLIALQVVHVASTAGKDSPFVPMAGAAGAFVLGAVLLAVFDKRVLYLLGAFVQLIVIIGYFAVSPSRSPHFEIWGLLVKVAQLVMLALLVYLAVRAPGRKAGPGDSASR